MPFTAPPQRIKFYEQVWTLVRQVPRGRVTTYGQIARLIPPPAGVDPEEYRRFGPRWVGAAMAACPDDVPWQRVINAQGKISDRPEAIRQRHLLASEGVLFVGDRVDLTTYLWRGPGQEDAPRQARLL